MAELTQEERDRIFQEEKAKKEAQQRLAQEETKKGCRGCLTVIAVIFGISLIYVLLSSGGKKTETVAEKINLHATVYRTSTQIKITNTDDFTWNNVQLTLDPGWSSYHYTISTIKPGVTVEIGLMRFTTTEGKRFNPFERVPQMLLISADTNKGAGSTGVGWK